MIIEIKCRKEAKTKNHPVYEVWMCGNMGRARMRVFDDLQDAIDYKRVAEEPHICDDADPTEFVIVVEEAAVSLHKARTVTYYE